MQRIDAFPRHFAAHAVETCITTPTTGTRRKTLAAAIPTRWAGRFSRACVRPGAVVTFRAWPRTLRVCQANCSSVSSRKARLAHLSSCSCWLGAVATKRACLAHRSTPEPPCWTPSKRLADTRLQRVTCAVHDGRISTATGEVSTVLRDPRNNAIVWFKCSPWSFCVPLQWLEG